MKNLAAILTLLLAASVMPAQTPPATTTPPGVKTAPAKTAPTVKAAPGAAIDSKVAPAKTGISAKTPLTKELKKEEEPKIPGMTIARPNGTFLGLEVVGGNFKLSFYDAKKKAMAVDVTRATARWPNPRAPGDNRTVLNVSGTALVGQKPVVPPYNFNVFLTLLKGDGEEAKAEETYTVAFRM